MEQSESFTYKHTLSRSLIISLCRSSVQRWLKLSSAYAESPLRVGCLEWPLRVAPAHALQLQAVAALKALNPLKSRHAQVGKSVCLCVCVYNYTSNNICSPRCLVCYSTPCPSKV